MTSTINRALAHLGRHYRPFTHLDASTLHAAGRLIRTYDLLQGESITLVPAGRDDMLFIAAGAVSLIDEVAVAAPLDADGEALPEPVDLGKLPGPATLRAERRSVICRVELGEIYALLSIGEMPGDGGEESSDLLARVQLPSLLRTRVFRSLPLEVLDRTLRRIHPRPVAAGEEVIRQDERGDTFFIIQSGAAEVWREELEDDEPQMVAVLGPGDSFGEEALIIGGGRNATVRMIDDGVLLSLNKDDFEEVVSRPLTRSVTPAVAKAMMDSGHPMIDVRYEDEYQESFVPGSILMPLPDIRSLAGDLDPGATHLVMCAAGKRASAAAMLLRQRGIEALVVEGGMRNWPYRTNTIPELELVLFDFCPYAQRAVITLLHTGTPCKLTYIDAENKPDWFDRVSPLGKVPILRIDGRTHVFESSVINEYVAQVSGRSMLPADPIERTRAKSWIEFGATCLGGLMKMVQSADRQGYDAAAAAVLRNLAMLEKQVHADGPFFLGEEFSLVDSTYAPVFQRVRELDRIESFCDMESFPRLQRWSESLAALAEVNDSINGDFSDIYRRFVRRKGPGGHVDRLLARFDTAAIA